MPSLFRKKFRWYYSEANKSLKKLIGINWVD